MTIRSGRVAELTAPGTFTIREQPFPPPPAGQVLVKVLRVGVCASDLHDWLTGPIAGQSPPRLGHEPVGLIEAVGDGVEGLHRGQTVTGRLTPAFADYLYAHPEDVVIVPDTIDSTLAIGEPLGCVVEGYRRAQPPIGADTAVIGLGFMGLVMTRLLTLSPVASVWAIDPRADARQAAATLGATHLAAPDDPGLPVDSTGLVVEASGTQPGLDLATRLAAEQGVLSILGYHQASSRAVDMRAWNWKALDIINAHVRDRHRLADSTRAAIGLLASGAIPMGALLTHTYPIERLNDAYKALRDKPAGFVKAVIIL